MPETHPESEPIDRFHKAFEEDDAATVQELFERFPEFKAKINLPITAFDAPVITHVRSRAMLDVLLDAGADINAKSRWWAGGFGLLHCVDRPLAEYAMTRGAIVDVHAAARLGLLSSLHDLVAADPALVHARGGDGQTPLHFASTVEVAEFLLSHGADIDARDIDHESTPVQHMIRDRQEVARHLVTRGCAADLFVAAALGDVALARRLLDAGPDAIHRRVSPEYFPMTDPKAGGTIYQWTLGWHAAPHDVARQFGHHDLLRLLLERSPPQVKLLDACWNADDSSVVALLAEYEGLVDQLPSESLCLIAHAARNNQTGAVRSMLAAGFPVDAPGQHQGTALHWAAFHGNAEMTRELLKYHPPIEILDADFKATPLGWALHGSVHGWHRETGQYPATVKLLLEAGAQPPTRITDGTEAVRTVLRGG